MDTDTITTPKTENGATSLDNNIDYAYIAGLIEGEGCIIISKQKKYGKNRGPGFVYRPRIVIQMRDSIPLEIVTKHFPTNLLAHNNIYKIQYCTNQTIEIIKQIFPYLTFKHDEASTLLKLHDTKLPCNHNKHSPEIVEHRRQLYLQCQEYKKKRPKDYNVNSPINPPEILDSPSETDLSYLAGIIDGEGSMGIYNQKIRGKKISQLITLSIAMVRLEAISKLQKHFGGKIFIQTNRNPTFRIKYSSRSAITVLTQILPYLKLKKRQAELCIDFYNKFPNLSVDEKQDIIFECQQNKYKNWFGEIIPFDNICLSNQEINDNTLHITNKRIYISSKEKRVNNINKIKLKINKFFIKLINSIIQYYPYHETNPGFCFTMTFKRIGYSRLEFKKRLESLFTPTMSWNNFNKSGGWTIDYQQNENQLNNNSSFLDINKLALIPYSST